MESNKKEKNEVCLKGPNLRDYKINKALIKKGVEERLLSPQGILSGDEEA